MEIIQKCSCGGVINYQLNIVSGNTDKVCSDCSKKFGSYTNDQLHVENWRAYWRDLNNADTGINSKININDRSMDLQ